MALLRLHTLKQRPIHAEDGEIGHLSDVYFDDQTWTVRYLVINTGVWLLGRRVLVPPQAVASVENACQVHVALTRDRVRTAPAIDTEKPVSRQQEEAYFHHFGWLPYWDGGLLPGPGLPAYTGSAGEARTAGGDRHLRSANEICGYQVQSHVDEIGFLSDVVISPETWRLRYAEVDIGGLFAGRKTLVACHWIAGISWESGTVCIDLPKEAVETAPTLSHRDAIDSEFEHALCEHYGRSCRNGSKETAVENHRAQV